VDGTGSILAERVAAIAFDVLPRWRTRQAILAPNFERSQPSWLASTPWSGWFLGRNSSVPRLRATCPLMHCEQLLRDFETPSFPAVLRGASPFPRGAGIPGDVFERGLGAIGRALHTGASS